MKIHVIQHSPISPCGTLKEWADAKGHELQIIKPYEGDLFPSSEEIDFLVILGGHMNVDDAERFPWLNPEKKLLRELCQNKVMCLGICLGAQLLAQALGGRVKKHSHWEVGWHSVMIGSDQRLTVFQWHEDTFELPPGAIRVAKNKITENQAFAFGNHVVGLQFHPEATVEWVHGYVSQLPMPEGPHVQPVDQIYLDLVLIAPMKKWFFELLDRLESIAGQLAISTQGRHSVRTNNATSSPKEIQAHTS